MSLGIDFTQTGDARMRVDLGGYQIRVAEQFLHSPQISSSVQQVCGVRMSERMNRGFLADTAGPKSRPKGILDVADGGGSLGGGTVNAAASGSGKDPHGVAMGFPVLAEQLQGRVGQGDVTILAALAVMDVNQLPGAVDVTDLEVSAFLQAQSTGIDGGETSPIAKQSDLRENLSHFFPAEDDGQLLFSRRAHQLERGQRTLEGVLVEELQAAQGDGGAAAGPVLDVLDVEKVLPQFFVADLIRRLVIVLGQLADGPDIHLLGACRHATQLQVFDHA